VADTTDKLRALTRETQEIWDQKAEHWDAQMGDGNAFQRVLVGPSAERLLAIQPGETVADIGCGNGVFARRLAELGAFVVASDFSAQFIERAKARTSAHGERIDYRVADATDEAQLLALGEGRFNAAVCNMALMDMTTVGPLLRAVPRLLKPDGRFVFAIPHPCFNNNDVRFVLEEEDRAGTIVERYAVRVADYLHVPPGKGAGMPGEPVPHYYFHRPLHELLGACFAVGLMLDGIEEPAFGPEHTSARPLSWVNFHDIPPVLVARLRPRDG
jgi:2-polyprenyl-3-methyl-5-hydroxy-6-metoxy-1,4-benzoquinol methylase